MTANKVQKSKEEWRAELSPEEYAVLREAATERPWTGPLLEEKRVGVYRCRACGTELFRSTTKFDSHCGWPSFYDASDSDAVRLIEDRGHGMVRAEVRCATCDSHLGHLFDDAPQTPTGDRYCMNSVSLTFEPAGDEGSPAVSRAELAGADRVGRVTPRRLVEESLRRIEAANGDLNAVVSLRADAALIETDRHPRTGALAGLPLLVKDLARTVGLPTTFGSHLYAHAPPDEVDDLFVTRLKRAGAIVVGKTNTPAFGHTGFTDNQVFGPTRNPWNLSRSPGGSSGGAGAALAAGLAPLATSSDGGGSVRIPAALCGLVGYKATNGAIGRNVLPRWIEFSTQGPTASTVADVVHLGEIMAGPADGDWISHPAGTSDLTPTRPARVLTCGSFRAGVDPTIAADYRASLDALG